LIHFYKRFRLPSIAVKMAAKGEPVSLGGTAIKPKGWDRTGMESLKYFIYDPDTGAVLSRTPASWAKIILFYSIYYSVLTVFWVACLQIFFKTLPDGRPKWLLDKSMIGSNPGLGLRPTMPESRIDSSLYVLKAASEDMEPSNESGEGDKNVDYAIRMKQFLDRYGNDTGMVDCPTNAVRKEGEEYCRFDLSVLGGCGEYPYGYVVDYPSNNVISPCFLLKLNKIYNWVPTPVKKEKLDDPEYETMSPELKTRIRKSFNTDYLWIDCAGRYPADKEVLDIQYFPEKQGIPLKYFPFRGGHYNPPLVAIKVRQRPVNGAVTFGQLIHIECRAWYDGVKHSTKDKLGLLQFDVILAPEN